MSRHAILWSIGRYLVLAMQLAPKPSKSMYQTGRWGRWRRGLPIWVDKLSINQSHYRWQKPFTCWTCKILGTRGSLCEVFVLYTITYIYLYIYIYLWEATRSFLSIKIISLYAAIDWWFKTQKEEIRKYSWILTCMQHNLRHQRWLYPSHDPKSAFALKLL